MPHDTARFPRPAPTWSVVGYFVPLTVLLYLIDPVGPFFDIAATVVLKHQLHASLSETTHFRLWTALPVYGGLVFGLIRDRMSPFGRGDRGYFLVAGSLLMLLMVWMAAQPLTYTRMTLGVVLAMILTRFLVAAYQGLMAWQAQHWAMSGRMAAVWQFTTYATALGLVALSGLTAQHGSSTAVFLCVAIAAAGIVLYALWRPHRIYDGADLAHAASSRRLTADLKRLFRYPAIYPAMAAMLMFQFSPGQGVVLQFYLVDHLKASEAMYGYWYAAFLAGFLPMFVLYGFLCRRLSFDRLLRWSAVIAIPQVLPLAFIHSAVGALWLAVPMGLMGGLFWAALHDLAIRSCPPALQGALMMIVSGVNALGTRAGDLIGAQVYASDPEHGFLWCALLTTVVYTTILAVIRAVPAQVSATVEGTGWSAHGLDHCESEGRQSA